MGRRCAAAVASIGFGRDKFLILSLLSPLFHYASGDPDDGFGYFLGNSGS